MNIKPPYGIILLINLLLLFSHVQFAQDSNAVKFDHLSSENFKLVKGVSQNWIYSIIQDQYGYIWFGTWDGLNKYDGYNFTTYNVADGLSDHTIYSMVEDFEGILWIGTDNGLTKFDPRRKIFKQFESE